MSIILKRLIPMSMLVINLITTHYCFNKKEQTKKAIIILIGFTMFVLLISSLIKSIFNIQFIEGILMILLGATYFFPIKYIYQERNRNVLSVMIFSWIHTFTVTYFSLYLSDYLISKDTSTYAFIFQNLIFLITTPLVIRFIKKRFIYILNHIPKKIYHYLLTLSGLEFMILIITFTLLTKNSNPIWIISIGFGITAVSMIVYSLIYLIVKNQNEIYDLEEIVFIDHLTKLKNRAALFKDLNEYIENDLRFKIMYMDLDSFKSINDKFGHLAGDDYLKEFAKSLKELVGEDGDAYRVAGDEFAYVLLKNQASYSNERINEIVSENNNLNKEFNGVSVGSASYPNDGLNTDALLKIADDFMYKNKRKK